MNLRDKFQRYAELNKTASARDMSATEVDYKTWLGTHFSDVLTAELAQFHHEFWDWIWKTLHARRDGKPLPEGNAYFAIWARGFGKSSNAEIVPLLDAALNKTGLALYVSGTQEMANRHLANIADLVARPEFAEAYPELAEPKRGKTGFTQAWRHTQLTFKSGYTIIAVGLDTGIRGVRIGKDRPGLMVLDDVDEASDSFAVAEKRLEQLTRKILPAGSPQTVIISAQNLIHKHGVINRIYEGKVTALANRRISGPHPAITGLRTERQGIRDVIVAGAPTWAHLGIHECQAFIDNSGLNAFLAEYQHSLKAAQQGLIFPEFDEKVHIITWSQFRRVYRMPDDMFCPPNWSVKVGLDWGSTGYDKHPTVVSFITTSAHNSVLPNISFLFGGLTFDKDCLVDDVANAIRSFLGATYEDAGAIHSATSAARRGDYAIKHVAEWRMSSEAASERSIFRQKHGMWFRACDDSKTAGIAHIKAHLRIDEKLRHPFKPDVMGASSFYWIVDDSQLITPADDFGLKRHREEVIDYRYAPMSVTELGLGQEKPIKMHDDAMDSLRMLMTNPPIATPLTASERRELAYPENLRSANAPQPGGADPWALDGWLLGRVAWQDMQRRRKQQERDDHWSHDIMEPPGGPDDSWNTQSPWEGHANDPWRGWSRDE